MVNGKWLMVNVPCTLAVIHYPFSTEKTIHLWSEPGILTVFISWIVPMSFVRRWSIWAQKSGIRANSRVKAMGSILVALTNQLPSFFSKSA